MMSGGLAVAITIAVWWAATVGILYLNGLRAASFQISMLCASGLLIVALCAIAAIRGDTTTLGAYAGFAAGILVWGWLEMSFLLGYVTGPRKHACAESASGPAHFIAAVQTILYHEIAALLIVAVIAVLSYGAANRTALGVIAILWSLRLSAKLNLYLGVRNTSEELLPAHLRYLGSYFRQRNFNVLFPFSVAGMVALIVGLARAGLRADASDFQQLQALLLCALAALGLLEHLLMIVPVNAARLWTPGLLSRQRAP